MSVTVEPGDPRDPAARALLESSQALMRELYNPEDNHFLSVDELCAPHIAFFVAKLDGITQGCGALATMDGYGEIKSMFVTPESRGNGLGDALMAQIEGTARAQSLRFLRLETGDTLVSAQKLYARHGFTERGPFGDYQSSPYSLFLEKALT